MKNQIFFIHGGMTFKNYEDYINYLKNKSISLESKKYWIQDVAEKLKEVQVIVPRMPLQENAKYDEWKIYFERFFSELNDGIILIGSSLGGIFLAKYLSENKFPKKILSVYLTCPPFDDSLPGEDLVGGFKLQSDLSLIEKQTKNLYLMFSKNDDVVPISHAEKFREKLPNSKIIIFESKNGHFQIEEFPELIEMIKKDLEKIR